PWPGQLVMGAALPRTLPRQRRAAASQPDPGLPRDRLSEPARREVLPRERAGLRLPEVALVERRRALEHRVQPFLPLPLAIRLRRRLLVLERDVEAVRQPLDRPDEVELLGLLDEIDRVAALAAAEAVKGSTLRHHRERRRLLLVERAETLVARAHLAQPRPPLDDRDDVDRGLHRLDRRVLDPRH